MMQQDIEVLLFVTLGVMILVWFALVLWLFSRLRTRHPAEFAALGSPSLIWNNSPRNNWLFLKFLFGSQCCELGDKALTNVCRVMRVWIIAYSVLIVVLVVSVAT